MLLLIILLIIDLIILNKFVVKDKMKQKFLNIFLLFNMFMLFISYLNPYGLFEVSDNVYLYYLLYIFILTITIIILGNKEKKATSNSKELLEKINYFTSTKFAKIISSMILIILLIYYIRFVSFSESINDGGIIREMYYNSFFKSTLDLYFYNFFASSIKDIIVIIVAIQIITNSKKNYFFIVGCIILILSALIGNGRMGLFNFIIYCVFLYSFFNSQKINISQLKNLFKLITCFVLIFLVSLVVVNNRLNNESFLESIPRLINEQLESVIIYFIGGFRNLEIYLNQGFNSIQNYTYIRATFGGLEEILSIPLVIFGFKYNTFNNLVGPITQQINIIGNGITFNAFYTCIMNFYNDLGIVGIIVYSFLFGLITLILFKNYKKNHKLFDLILLMYFLVNILFSSIYRWNLQNAATTFSIIVMLFFSINENKLFKKYCKKEEGSQC